jgi:hypothetical protein
MCGLFKILPVSPAYLDSCQTKLRRLCDAFNFAFLVRRPDPHHYRDRTVQSLLIRPAAETGADLEAVLRFVYHAYVAW